MPPKLGRSDLFLSAIHTVSSVYYRGFIVSTSSLEIEAAVRIRKKIFKAQKTPSVKKLKRAVQMKGPRAPSEMEQSRKTHRLQFVTESWNRLVNNRTREHAFFSHLMVTSFPRKLFLELLPRGALTVSRSTTRCFVFPRNHQDLP